MAENDVCFVEWKEEYVSQERGSRIVHYILKDFEGKNVLAVVGTERSLRHMVYVVAEEYLNYYPGEDNPIQPGFKWRSRREVVDWLTSMLAKQQADSSRDSTHSLDSSELLGGKHFSLTHKVDRRVRNLKQSYSDIVWLGAAWTCGKQLKHYPAFCRNGTTIAVQSFVFVMAKEETRYVAYLEDMYEDKKRQKKVKVRWFHHSQEVKGVVRLRNAHPKEVYITPYTQVISVECVDGPSIVLTREHFEKCISSFPDGLLGKVHLCFRQFRSNKIKPFDLSKLRGYFDQPIISCLESDAFLNLDSGVEMFTKEENAGKGIKRTRNTRDRESILISQAGMGGGGRKKVMYAPLCKSGKSDMNKRLLSSKNVESLKWHTQIFKVDDKIELLCQDSGIRGCWFRCTVLEICRKQMKLQYSDLEDQDEHGNLEEWVSAFRLAAPDKLGMRCLGRPTLRPCPPITNSEQTKFEVGAPVDAWWSDGWWEGVVTAVNYAGDDNLQIYIPGENMFLNVPRKDLRVSRDWIGGKWVDVKDKPDILSVIGPETNPPMISTLEKDDEPDDSALQTKVDVNEDKESDLGGPASSVGHPEQVSISDKEDKDGVYHEGGKINDVSIQDMCCDGEGDGNGDGHYDENDTTESNGQTKANLGAEDMETAGHNEQVKSGAEDMDTAAQNEAALELTPVIA